MNRELLSLGALTVITEAMNHYRKSLISEADAPEIPSDRKAYLEESVIQIDNVFDSVEFEYERLRRENPSSPTYKELKDFDG